MCMMKIALASSLRDHLFSHNVKARAADLECTRTYLDVLGHIELKQVVLGCTWMH